MSSANLQPTVLVTGGAGYIGSVLVTLLLRHGFRVRVIDCLDHGGEALLGFISHPGFEFLHGDICKSDYVDVALQGVDSVVHLAAIVGDPACAANPKRATEINKTASEMLCERAIKAGVKRFVFASTCSNYGKMGDDVTGDDVTWVDESSPLQPVSHYAELKVGFEKFVLARQADSFTTTCLRFATAYGLSPRPRFDLTVNEFTRDLFLKREIKIYGEKFWRPYCNTLDLAHACLLVLVAETGTIGGQAFNVGSTGQNFTKRDLVQMILSEMPDRKELISYVTRDEDSRDYRVNCDKIKSTLGFAPAYTVADGIREIISALAAGLISDPDNPRYRNLK